MPDWLLDAIQEPVYWLWCRWRGHGAFPVINGMLETGGEPIRGCWGCGRVYAEDEERLMDAVNRNA